MLPAAGSETLSAYIDDNFIIIFMFSSGCSQLKFYWFPLSIIYGKYFLTHDIENFQKIRNRVKTTTNRNNINKDFKRQKNRILASI